MSINKASLFADLLSRAASVLPGRAAATEKGPQSPKYFISGPSRKKPADPSDPSLPKLGGVRLAPHGRQGQGHLPFRSRAGEGGEPRMGRAPRLARCRGFPGFERPAPPLQISPPQWMTRNLCRQSRCDCRLSVPRPGSPKAQAAGSHTAEHQTGSRLLCGGSWLSPAIEKAKELGGRGDRSSSVISTQ